MSRLLMVDDDEKLVALMRDYLESHGFELLAAHEGHAGVEKALSVRPDLVILDLMLPGIDGLEVCRRVRQSSRVPILMLTAKGDETDRIVGLEMGADDYLPKPFNARELLARIRAVLRRSEGVPAQSTSSAVRAGALVVDPGSRAVSLHGREIELTTAEFDVGSSGRVVKSFWLAIKIAAVFLFVMGTFVIVTLRLFASTMIRTGAHGDLGGADAHHVFVVSVLKIFFVAMILMIAFSIYVTAPLRRMSRSMDRIAAGDLEHRVVVRGNDEGSAMGRSFNAMAERVRGMIVGQKELLAGVSHELRSPLTRMKVSLELLREGKGGGDRIQDLESDVDALDSMVEELLLASRLDLGSAPISRERLELADVCAVAWNRVADHAQALGMTLDLQCGEGARGVQANRALTVRLLGNLFENSVRHAKRGRITVSAVRREDRVELAVTDAGPGVEAEDLERLFEPFFRADRSRSRRTGAGGLGLMIVRRAVEAHGGSVSARSVEPSGLAVTFDLPAYSGATPNSARNLASS